MCSDKTHRCQIARFSPLIRGENPAIFRQIRRPRVRLPAILGARYYWVLTRFNKGSLLNSSFFPGFWWSPKWNWNKNAELRSGCRGPGASLPSSTHDRRLLSFTVSFPARPRIFVPLSTRGFFVLATHRDTKFDVLIRYPDSVTSSWNVRKCCYGALKFFSSRQSRAFSFVSRDLVLEMFQKYNLWKQSCPKKHAKSWEWKLWPNCCEQLWLLPSSSHRLAEIF